VTRPDDDHRVACATLTYLAEPADPALGRLLQVLSPAEVLASIRSGTIPARAVRAMNQAQAAGLRPALARWQSQLPRVSADTALARHAADDVRLVCAGEPGWPTQLDDLGTARLYALWVRGAADLQTICEKSLAVVGAGPPPPTAGMSPVASRRTWLAGAGPLSRVGRTQQSRQLETSRSRAREGHTADLTASLAPPRPGRSTATAGARRAGTVVRGTWQTVRDTLWRGCRSPSRSHGERTVTNHSLRVYRGHRICRGSDRAGCGCLLRGVSPAHAAWRLVPTTYRRLGAAVCVGRSALRRLQIG
jgi:hypothetical protein